MAQLFLRDDIEYVVHCNIIGPLSKAHAHMRGVRETLVHYSTWAMVYNPRIWKYGLQLKSIKKHDAFSKPKWDMGVAGHNCYTRTEDGYHPLNFNETLIKETDEEIGLGLRMFDTLDEFINASYSLDGTIGFIFEQFHSIDELNNEWVGMWLVLTTEENLEFKDGEVLEFKWITPDELNTVLSERSYHSALPIAFKKAEDFRLQYLAV